MASEIGLSYRTVTFLAKEITCLVDISDSNSVEVNCDASEVTISIAVNTRKGISIELRANINMKNDSGPVLLKRATDNCAACSIDTPWCSRAIDAIIDVAVTASVEMAIRMLIAVSVMSRVEKVPRIKIRHRALLWSNHTQDISTRAKLSVSNDSVTTNSSHGPSYLWIGALYDLVFRRSSSTVDNEETFEDWGVSSLHQP
jgi:hypothetical protein